MPVIFVGNLPFNARSSELEDLFRKYGAVASVRMKPNFAFVDMPDNRDAEDAVDALQGETLDGKKLRIEVSKDKKCATCGKRGHLAKECRGSDDRNSGACFACGEVGHKAISCPNDRRGGGRRDVRRASRERDRSPNRRNRYRSRSSDRERSYRDRSRTPESSARKRQRSPSVSDRSKSPRRKR
eukprot:TRINITY_DN82819_c0_g1_i1.p1 TRINITY_DN82819_c0_g1~~TRINITY_DN82819_c0_g1_i1.p1  ORF type:complete len:215 (+),score=15.50 TRINITY_DN82819_c0_g1_i1:95-646(+)